MAAPRRTGSLERGVGLRTMIADVAQKLDAEARRAEAVPDRERSLRARALPGRAQELDGRLSSWGLNMTTNSGRTEDLLECQDLLAEARKLGV